MRLKELCPHMNISVQAWKGDQFLFGVGNKRRKNYRSCLYNKFSGALIGMRRGRGALIGDGALIEKARATRGAYWRRGAYWKNRYPRGTCVYCLCLSRYRNALWFWQETLWNSVTAKDLAKPVKPTRQWSAVDRSLPSCSDWFRWTFIVTYLHWLVPHTLLEHLLLTYIRKTYTIAIVSTCTSAVDTKRSRHKKLSTCYPGHLLDMRTSVRKKIQFIPLRSGATVGSSKSYPKYALIHPHPELVSVATKNVVTLFCQLTGVLGLGKSRAAPLSWTGTSPLTWNQNGGKCYKRKRERCWPPFQAFRVRKTETLVSET